MDAQAQDIDLLLNQAMTHAPDRFPSIFFDFFDASNVDIASTLHENTVGAYETTAQDLDTLSQAGTVTVASWDGAYDMD